MPAKPGQPRPTKPAPESPVSTRLESDDEIRQALQARRVRLAGQAPPAPSGAKKRIPTAPLADDEPQAERPIERPPVGLLCILDDGKHDGEWVRLRTDRTVIGRSEGDVLIPHDPRISGKHFEIVRKANGLKYQWFLVDLQSTNGTFVRIGSTPLRHDHEILIGRGRYRFEAGSLANALPAAASGGAHHTTQPWTSEPMRALVPSLVEVTPAGPVYRFALTLPEYWIGRDTQTCAIARPDDGLVNARHARLYRDANGQWHIENNKSLNGLWFRVTEPIPLGKTCLLRAGEQRFLFRARV